MRDPADPTNTSQGLKAVQVSTGYSHSLAVGSNGYAYAWGDNQYGQLGNNSTNNSTVPALVRDPADPTNTSQGLKAVQVSTGYSHSLAVGSNGYAYAWGDNQYGQLGNNSTNNSTVPALVRDPADPTNTSQGLKAVQVSTGYSHSLAVGSNGYAYAWGDNQYGQLGNNSTNNSTVPALVRDPADPTNTSQGLKAVQVSTGYSHSLAVGSNGYAYAWGDNQYGQLGNNSTNNSTVPALVRDPADPTNTSQGLKAVQVSTGYSHSLAVGSNGYAYAWGDNQYGQLGNNSTNNSTVPALVRDPADPTNTSQGLKAVQVSTGYSHSLAVGSNGYAYAWGDNQYGQLGNNSTNNSTVPALVRDPADPTNTSQGLKAVQVSTGYSHSLAVGSNGYAYAWGDNQYGQLGNNSTNNSTVPALVRDPADPTNTSQGLKAVQVSTGYSHSLAVGTDGGNTAWGDNQYGQLGNDGIPTGENNSKAKSPVPAPVVLNPQPVITSVRFDQTPLSGLRRGDDGSVNALTPAHLPGTVTVSVDYTIGGAPQKPDTTLRYTYTPATPAGVLPQAGGEGILLALATGTVSMGGVLASRRHRKETHSLSHASHE
ncbi:hypothetical protein CI601_04595 [Bifidobacterium sp. wkB344]|nr:hypothetical protein CI601_04595 [Bifidobacterium sp. wkB344]